MKKFLSFFIRLLSLMPIMETLSMMLNNLTYQIMMKKKDHYQQGETKK